MDFRELRIGNVISLGNRVGTIAWFDSKNMATVYDLEETQDTLEDNDRIRPEKLTEEWLVKFGFENNSSFGTEYYEIGKVRICQDDGLAYIEDLWGIELKHVHQLQNLYFALTGEELTLQH